MKRLSFFAGLAIIFAGFFLVPAAARADSKLSVENLNRLDEWGWFTPSFKDAVHDLVDTKKETSAANKETLELKYQLPELQRQATDAEAKVTVLRGQLAEYDHTDESDFVQLKKTMTDPGVKPEDQVVLAQAYVWAYPLSPHQSEAQQDLQQVQKKMADQVQAAKDAEAAQIAAHALLVQRAQAHQLSLGEWRDFLRDMSQEDVVKILGRPQYQGEYWTYTGDWTEDPATHQKVGLQISFNAARVTSVAEVRPVQ